MSLNPKWINKKALLLLHEESLSYFGGGRGIKDEGLLESALARPQNLLAYNPEADIFDLTASYAYGLARNHAFVDGNKRAAFLSIGIFLHINGYAFKADQVDAIETITALAAGTVEEKEIAVWIKNNSQPLKV
jgi:death-on-curing protein